MSSFKTLSLQVTDNGVGIVTFDNGKYNVMSLLFWREMVTMFEEVAVNSDIRVVLFTSKGKFFTAGLDLEFAATLGMPVDDDDIARTAYKNLKLIKSLQQSFTVLEKIPQPVVCAINGPCIGGGVDLVTASDIRLCTSSTYFSIKEVDVGLAADVGTLQRLPKIIGSHSLVRDLCFTGRNLHAKEALSCGLVSSVHDSHDSLMQAAMKLCNTIAAKSPIAVVTTKRTLNHARDYPVDQGLEYVAMLNMSMLQTEDIKVGMMAKMQKQKPIYSKL